MANREHLAILRKGVTAWNEWREQVPGVLPDLSDADLRRTDLRNGSLRLCRLINADLSLVNLQYADLRGADLERASLTSADLSHANLEGGNLAGALLAYTTLTDVNLSLVRGLTEVVHNAPTIIDIETVSKSNGIPETFLRATGASDSLIAYARSITGSQIEYQSCFISYSTKDQDFADWLYADLQAKGVRCWFAPHDIQGGRKIHEQIDEAIRLYDKLLLILSPHSMASEWVGTEIAKARKREVRDKTRVLFPIRLVSFEAIRDWENFDADTGKDSAREVREYFIPDFSNWKDHDSYQKAFERLLKDLKAASKAVVAGDRTVRITEQGHITDRYIKAIEQLGKLDGDKPNIEVRLGAIYVLERIALDSPLDHWTIMEVLTAYVRQNAPAVPDAREDADAKLRTDIQAALTVIGRRKVSQAAKRRLDLSNTNLRSAQLSDAQLERADLNNAQLQRADLSNAHLEEANLRGAILQHAWLREAQLQRANLSGAQLQGVTGIDVEQVKAARNWQEASYDREFAALLGLSQPSQPLTADSPSVPPAESPTPE